MDPLLVLRDYGLLDAGVLALGLERGWVDRQTIAMFAREKLTAGNERPEVVELAACEQMEADAIIDLLRRWANKDAQPSVTSEQALRRWLFAFLKGVAHSNSGPEEKLDRLEELYGYLGYPDEMRVCSRYYVPPDDRSRRLRIGDMTESPLDAMNKLIATLLREFSMGVS